MLYIVYALEYAKCKFRFFIIKNFKRFVLLSSQLPTNIKNPITVKLK